MGTTIGTRHSIQFRVTAQVAHIKAIKVEVAEKSQMQANDSGVLRTDAAYVLYGYAETKDAI